MRACFLAQNVCALGYGVAMVQAPPAPEAPPFDRLPEQAKPPVAAPNRMFEALRKQPHYS